MDIADKDCLIDLKDDKDVVSWNDFVVACKDAIIADIATDSIRQYKGQLRKKVRPIADGLGITIKYPRSDNWHIIEKARNTANVIETTTSPTSQVSSSSSASATANTRSSESSSGSKRSRASSSSSSSLQYQVKLQVDDKLLMDKI
ncbi:hypothetical protein MBANPS3_008893 [Mucor bainieri]